MAALAFHFAVCLFILQGHFAGRVCVHCVCVYTCSSSPPFKRMLPRWLLWATNQPTDEPIPSHRVYATWSHHSIKTLTAVNGFLQPTHKMQSGDGAPTISLQLVPKMLAPLASLWVPHAFVVSFKLETDESLLIVKARDSLNKYKHKVSLLSS